MATKTSPAAEVEIINAEVSEGETLNVDLAAKVTKLEARNAKLEAKVAQLEAEIAQLKVCA